MKRYVKDPREKKVKGGRWDATPCTCAACKRVLARQGRSQIPSIEHVSSEPSPWSVLCAEHGRTYLTWHGYVQQLGDNEHDSWRCPFCLKPATFDGENLGAFEDALKTAEDEEKLQPKKTRGAERHGPAPRGATPQRPDEGAEEW